MNRALLTTVGFISLTLIAALAPGAPSPAKKTEAANPLAVQGHVLFLSNCAPCHGADAGGDDGPSLHHKMLADTVVVRAIKDGFKDEMPPFRSKLKAPQLKAIVAYVRTLQR